MVQNDTDTEIDTETDTDEELAELDALIGNLGNLVDELEAEATENRQKRQQADQEGGHVETEDGEELSDQPEREYQAQVFLLIPHNDTPQRPLPRRPQAPAPVDSAGVAVTRNGNQVDIIEPGKTYTIECVVHNAGGLGASKVNVELFVEHKGAKATVDTNPNGVLELSYDTAQRDQDFTGFSTFSPGTLRPPAGQGRSTPKSPVGYVMFDGSQLRWDNMIGTGRLPSLTAQPNTDHSQRSWIVGFGRKPQEYLITGSPYQGDTFTLRTYDITSEKSFNSLTYLHLGHPDRMDGKRDARSLVTNLNILPQLGEVDGKWVQGSQSNNQKEQLNLSRSVNSASMEGRTHTNISANSSKRVQFTYTAPRNQNQRVLTAFHTRAYSLAPDDTPQDWGTLDHTTSRFVGRSEVYWEVFPKNP